MPTASGCFGPGAIRLICSGKDMFNNVFSVENTKLRLQSWRHTTLTGPRSVLQTRLPISGALEQIYNGNSYVVEQCPLKLVEWTIMNAGKISQTRRVV
jgi:hypothetical protein